MFERLFRTDDPRQFALRLRIAAAVVATALLSVIATTLVFTYVPDTDPKKTYHALLALTAPGTILLICLLLASSTITTRKG